ncbi:mitochondrial 54S ribosomal protein bL12m KNAG_0F01990 [Huiozyma naganishii CBS 8797]|uniref:Ribosomal protein L7/L12 C-terminal domain-containing protein n=1 Tax=Huiozyma naganishii (strain ATCC MYA-139 / BCRC 22969 / CBS 8797 / KCTC 17520 / NBRC 10181 / NCYC 3082 / Yp74L-3) TaxID=1071383 RepID=J7S8D5_HUIN7|nr:hypothetical protein KNAG_0F01990 [Kazachstania naganishii CBS 8797]CCK70866.1 hypothetical protein KNAG_0F01990 [Kazachstania naganishii CBS 8797]
MSMALRRCAPRMVRATVARRFGVCGSLRLQSTQAASGASERVTGIVDSVEQLTLLETSQLIAELKTRLNIPETAFAAAPGQFVGGGAAGGAVGAGTGGAASGEDANASAVPKEEEQTTFTVKLDSFDAKGKAKIIKEVKSLLGLSLVDAKKFVEGAPKTIKENIGKDDAQGIKDTFEKLGAKVSLE